MAITSTSVLADSVQPLYDADFLLEMRKTRVWSQFPWWKKALGGRGLRGSSLNFIIIQEMAAATTALAEGSDVTPVALSDIPVQVTIAEYGNVVQSTELLDVESYPDEGQMAAQAVGQNAAKSMDRLVRAAAIGGSWVYYPNNNTARTGLDATNDLITFARLNQMVSWARNRAIPGFGNHFAVVLNPLAMVDVMGDSVWQAAHEYSGTETKAIFDAEVGYLSGLHFISHEYGKIYLSGGTLAQATTLSAAVAAGATTCSVADATGLAANDWVTLGTLESSSAEQVQITAISGTDLTIRGIGNTDTNFGCKYAHASGAAVTEAANVAGVVLIGPRSIPALYASAIGREPRASVEWASTNIPHRFLNHAWYWIGGFGRVEKHVLRGEFAVSGYMLGDN